MTNILVYDTEADLLEKVADRNDTTVAEIVEMLTEYLDQMLEENCMRQSIVKMEKPRCPFETNLSSVHEINFK